LGIALVVLYISSYVVIINPRDNAYSGSRMTFWSASRLGEADAVGGMSIYRREIHWSNYFFAPVDFIVQAVRRTF